MSITNFPTIILSFTMLFFLSSWLHGQILEKEKARGTKRAQRAAEGEPFENKGM